MSRVPNGAPPESAPSNLAGLLDQLREREAAYDALPEDDDLPRRAALDQCNDMLQQIAEVTTTASSARNAASSGC